MPKKSGKSNLRKIEISSEEDVYVPFKSPDDDLNGPNCLYFYYIGPEFKDDDGKIQRLRLHYYEPGDERFMDVSQVEDLARRLTLNARLQIEKQVPPPDGANLENIVWRRKSYVVFVLDSEGEGWTDGKRISFYQRDGYLRNHTFYDAWDFSIDLGGTPRHAVGFINYMWRGPGDQRPLGRAAQRFRFRLDPAKQPRYPDSGGTNMGPPIGPP